MIEQKVMTSSVGTFTTNEQRAFVLSVVQPGLAGLLVMGFTLSTTTIMRRQIDMKKKLYSILVMLLLTMITTSTVYAGGYVRLTGAPSSGSPLHLDGYLTGLGGYDPLGVTIVLTGSGIPVTTCINQGGTQAPGQNPPKVSATGSQNIGDDDITKNGKAEVHVVTEDLIGTTLPGKQGGCPNNTWTATIDAIAWTHATVWVYDNANGNWLYHSEYTCHLRDGSTTAYDCTLDFEEFNH